MNAAWTGVITDVTSYGNPLESRNGGSREFLNYSFWLNDIDSNLVTNPGRRLDPAYAAAETLWYLGGHSEVAPLLPYAAQYKRFAEPDGNAWGAYGKRVMHLVPDLINVLRADPNSRQAVLLVWRPTDLGKKVVDIPCTIALNFNVRVGQLHLTTLMRSNDVWLGLPYDVFAFTTIQRVVAAELGLPLGTYHHHATSMHIYDKDAVNCTHCSGVQHGSGKHRWVQPTHSMPLAVTHHAAKLWYEMSMGQHYSVADFEEVQMGWPMLGDLLFACHARLNGGDRADRITSPAMRAALQRRMTR